MEKISAEIFQKDKSRQKTRFYRSQILPRTATLLHERHTRISWDGSSLRTTITKHVPSFAPVEQHHLFLLDTTMERNFPWLYHQISSRGKILTCFLSFLILLLNSCLPLNTDTPSPNLEKANLCISERTNFPEIQTYFRVAKTVLDFCTRKFLFRRFESKTKTNFEGETLYRAPMSVTPSDYRIRKISDSRIFFGLLLSTLCGQAVISP